MAPDRLSFHQSAISDYYITSLAAFAARARDVAEHTSQRFVCEEEARRGAVVRTHEDFLPLAPIMLFV